MSAIFRRELKAYFNSLVGYIFLAAFYASSGVLYSITSLKYGSTDTASMFSMLFFVLLVLIPFLTMRTLSEDKRMKTDQCLLTAPVSMTGLVMGKYLSALVIYIMGVGMTLVYAVVTSFFGAVSWLEVFGNVVGLILVGAAYIAIGILISALTENQVIAAVGGFVSCTALYLISSIASIIPIEWISNILNKLSFSSRYLTFTYGIFDFSNVLFFISAAVIFIFLTVRVLERRRWS